MDASNPWKCVAMNAGSSPARRFDDRREVEVAVGDVVAQGDDELDLRRLLRPDARDRTEGPEPRLGADPPAERLPVEQRRAEPVEEAQVHRGVREETVRPRVVERHDGLWPVGG